MVTKRTFIAINLPNELKKSLGLIIEKLKKTNPDYAIRWMRPENLHLTLHFFGNLNEKQITQVEEGIEEVAKQIHSFKLTTGKFGCFPNKKNPRVIFIETKNTKTAHILVGELEVMLQNLGYKIDTRPWQAHITLGRIKNHVQCETDNVEFEPTTFEVKSIELMESQLSPEGSVYSVIKSFPLR